MTPGLQPLFWLRTTGFPFHWLDEHRCPEAAAIAAEAAAAQRELDELRDTLEAEVAARFPHGHRKLLRAIAEGAALDENAVLSARRWNEQLAALADARGRMEAQLAVELERSRGALHRRFGDDRLRLAIFNSSRQALTMFDRMRAEGPQPERASRERYREVEGYLFLQRLCAKNETVSFYGPLAWGEIGSEEEPTFRPASGLERRVSFEHWAVRALAQAINGDPALASDLPLRLNPTCRVDGDVLFFPVGKQRPITPSERALLERLPNRCTEAELEPLLRARIVERGLFVPTMIHRPEDRLMEMVSALPASPPRDRWMEILVELCRRRDEYAHASLEERAALTDAIDDLFRRHTGAEATRGEGQTYAGRHVLYEDCRLGMELRLGRRLADRIEQRLRPIVEICRWIARDVAGRIGARYREVHSELGGGAVDFIAFLKGARAVEQEDALIEPTRARLAAAWDSVLGSDRERQEIGLAEADLLRVVSALPPPVPSGPFSGEHFHSPDLLFAARGPDAFARDEFEMVLGEIHKVVFYEAHPVSWPFCPAQSDVMARLREVLPGDRPRSMDAPSQHHSRSHSLPAEVVIDVVGQSNAGRIAGRALPISEFVVEPRGEWLALRHLRSPLETSLLSAMQNLLHVWSDRISPVPLPAVAHVPRLRCGSFVLRRRSWRLEAAALADLIASRSAADALLAGARLAVRYGIARRVFIKSPEEPKPVFVDFEAPLALELLAKLARKAEWLRFTELYPTGDQLWFSVDGELRTSELRFTYVL